MRKKEKAQLIDRLQQVFSTCSTSILTDYRGLSTYEMNSLRRRLDELNIEYKVVKNTLARFAAERAGKNELVGLFEGPVAIASGYGDVTEPAKVLADYINTSKSSLSIKGGLLSDRVLTSGEVMILATLPPREVLLARVVGGIQSPLSALVSHLAAPIRGILTVLQARVQQMEGG
jgi:large subunit ribosomal protein L10